MARYVVVEFDKNEDADEFVSATLKNRKLNWGVRVVGVFVKPGKTCICGDWQRVNAGDKLAKFGVSLGGKFGWWICDRCGKPRRGGHMLFNQLDMSDTTEGVSYEGYEFGVTGLDVTGIHFSQVNRKKKLRRKKNA